MYNLFVIINYIKIRTKSMPARHPSPSATELTFCFFHNVCFTAWCVWPSICKLEQHLNNWFHWHVFDFICHYCTSNYWWTRNGISDASCVVINLSSLLITRGGCYSNTDGIAPRGADVITWLMTTMAARFRRPNTC